MNSKIFEEKYRDYVLVPLGLIVLGIYHLWLLFTIIRRPTTTVIGLNAVSRHQWVLHMMRVSPLLFFVGLFDLIYLTIYGFSFEF